MADYDSDSSGADDVETNVFLGYTSAKPTSDPFSQLGGHPAWLDGTSTPSGTLAKCKVCNGLLNLLLQIHADLPERFPGHERRLYIWACRRKACRRKNGSVRAWRATRQTSVGDGDATAGTAPGQMKTDTPAQSKPAVNLGETLFGVKSPTSTLGNPFSAQPNSSALSNPFAAASSLAAKPAQKPVDAQTLPETFAQKVRISSPEPQPRASQETRQPHEPWPEQSRFPQSYPSYHLDADKEYIESESMTTPSNVRIDRDGEGGGSSSSAAEDKLAFESTMDKTFQRFADRLAQNPEQVLRYEFAGQPLLYSKTDAVGKLFAEQTPTAARVQVQASAKSRIPKCENCGGERVFELQLTPHAITKLEAEEMSLDGMDWGTVIVGVCGKDCQERSKAAGEVGYVEEWVGVQWEEIAAKK